MGLAFRCPGQVRASDQDTSMKTLGLAAALLAAMPIAPAHAVTDYKIGQCSITVRGHLIRSGNCFIAYSMMGGHWGEFAAMPDGPHAFKVHGFIDPSHGYQGACYVDGEKGKDVTDCCVTRHAIFCVGNETHITLVPDPNHQA